MHLNGMHHMDIKSLNIMYHDIIDRFVFIDFGASDMLNDVYFYVDGRMMFRVALRIAFVARALLSTVPKK